MDRLQAGAPPVPSLDYLDRYRNEGTRNYSVHAAYSEVRPEYGPTTGPPSFELATYKLPRSRMNVHVANPPTALRERYLPDGSALFCVHPQVLAEIPDDPYVRRTRELASSLSTQRVSPSSSTRTLYVVESEWPHAVKVHVPFRVSRYGRRMRDEVVAQAIAVSAELERWERKEDLAFGFLREVLGVTHRDLDPGSARGENWGYLVRDMVPFPAVRADRRLVPGFALYGRDRFDAEAPPLILELVEASDPEAWALEKLLLPIVRQWVACFRDLGLILEPHGQNVLLEVDHDGAVRRVVHRDLSVGIDMRRRRDVGLEPGRLNRYNRMEDGAFASIAYDKFMGGHFFDSMLAPLLDRFPRLGLERFRASCREEFARRFPEHERYLPATVFYFSEQRDRFGKPLIEDTGRRPSWRP